MKKSDKIMLVTGGFLIVLNVAAVFVLNVSNITINDDKVITAAALMFSGLYFLVSLFVIIFARVKRYKAFLKGLLIYYLIAVADYLVSMIYAFSGKDQLFHNAASIFRWWTVPMQPVAGILSRGLSIPLSFRESLAFFLLLLSLLAAMMISGIQKDIAWEKKRAYEKGI